MCDLVDFTALAHRVDAEVLGEWMRTYHEVCEAPVSRFGGYVARYIGDCVLAYFGYPRAHEENSERAVHTGRVVVGELIGAAASKERTATDRFEARHRHGVAASVGRAAKLTFLMRLWALARAGTGHVVLNAGEPGIGKSPLTRIFRERIVADQHTVTSLHCSPLLTNSLLRPIVEWVRRAHAQIVTDFAHSRDDRYGQVRFWST